MNRILVATTMIALLLSCRSKKPAVLKPNKLDILQLKQTSNGIEVDSALDKRFTWTVGKYFLNQETPIILNDIRILDIFPLDNEVAGMKIEYQSYPAFYFKLTFPIDWTENIIKHSDDIHALAVRIDGIQKGSLPRNEEPDLDEFYNVIEREEFDYFGIGQLVDYPVLADDEEVIIGIADHKVKKDDCSSLTSFKTYNEAIQRVRDAEIKRKESITTETSSWIQGAEYYQCDSGSGFLIVTLKNGSEYIHKGVPIATWRGLKDAESKGSYYDNNIRSKYRLTLSE